MPEIPDCCQQQFGVEETQNPAGLHLNVETVGPVEERFALFEGQACVTVAYTADSTQILPQAHCLTTLAPRTGQGFQSAFPERFLFSFCPFLNFTVRSLFRQNNLLGCRIGDRQSSGLLQKIPLTCNGSHVTATQGHQAVPHCISRVYACSEGRSSPHCTSRVCARSKGRSLPHCISPVCAHSQGRSSAPRALHPKP